MNVMFLSTYDIAGGAARATYRLFKGIRSAGVDVKELVLRKESDDPGVITDRSKWEKLLVPMRRHLERIYVKRHYPGVTGLYSAARLPDHVWRKVNKSGADLLHLHWISAGFVSIESLAKITMPIVWTMHDMWPFTGGCHYDNECGRYQTHCASCPALDSKKERDLSYRIFERKLQHWQDLEITLVSPSHWLGECAKKSKLLGHHPVEVIPNGIDTSVYKPINKEIARGVLGVPLDKKLILFGAMNSESDKRKGYNYLISAIEKIAINSRSCDAYLVIFGASRHPESMTKLAMPTKYMGELKDEISMVVLYSAADVFVAPSKQDNLPNTIVESLACGTPCVAFDVGGMPDMINHKVNGYLANPFDVNDLAEGIVWVLADDERRIKMSNECRTNAVENYDQSTIVHKYIKLYEKMLG